MNKKPMTTATIQSAEKLFNMKLKLSFCRKKLRFELAVDAQISERSINISTFNLGHGEPKDRSMATNVMEYLYRFFIILEGYEKSIINLIRVFSMFN